MDGTIVSREHASLVACDGRPGQRRRPAPRRPPSRAASCFDQPGCAAFVRPPLRGEGPAGGGLAPESTQPGRAWPLDRLPWATAPPLFGSDATVLAQ